MKKVKKYNQIIIKEKFDEDDDVDLPENEDGFYFGEDEEDFYDNDEDDDDRKQDEWKKLNKSIRRGLSDDEKRALDLENGKNDEYEGDYEDDIDEDDGYHRKSNLNGDSMEHLAATIRVMISNIGIRNFYVNYSDFDMSIQFILNKSERFSKIMRIMGLLKKLQTDILIQYDSEVDLWQTNNGDPVLTVDFYYNTTITGIYDDDDLAF